MHDFMRKYKRHILVVVIGLIAVPFVLVYSMPGSGSQQQSSYEDPAIMQVGGIEVKESEFLRALDTMAQRRAQSSGERPTYKELDESNAVGDILEQLADSAYLRIEEEGREFDVDKEVLVKRMQQWNLFQTELEGAGAGDPTTQFDKAAWNEWLERNKGADWNAIYDSERKSVARQVYLEMLTAASGRVFDKEIEETLTQQYSKLKIRYSKVEPPVELTQEQIQTQYEENPDKYRKPDDLVAQFIAISLKPEMPETVNEVLKKAREGADFEALAKEHSATNAEKGGDMGWQSPREVIQDHRKPLFELAVGEVSEPVTLGPSYLIYKVEEERTNEESGKREVKARQITIRAELPEEEKEARRAQAEALSQKLKDNSGDLAAVAAEADLEVQRTQSFTKESTEIAGVDKLDARSFARSVDMQKEEMLYDVISASQNLYIAKAIERTQGLLPTLEEIKETVEKDALVTFKQTDEYKENCLAIAEKIEAQAATLNEAKEKFADSLTEIKETKDFSGKRDDMYTLFSQGLSFATTQIFDAVEDKEPGDMTGPVADYGKNQYFIELVSRTLPTEEEKQAWGEEEQKLREQAQMRAENALLQDYLLDLRTRMSATTPPLMDTERIGDILGRNDEEEEAPAEEATEASPEATEAPAEEEAEETEKAAE